MNDILLPRNNETISKLNFTFKVTRRAARASFPSSLLGASEVAAVTVRETEASAFRADFLSVDQEVRAFCEKI